SREAYALLLAIGLQETGFRARQQDGDGPARSFWQFERPGVDQVLLHENTRAPIGFVLRTLRYSVTDSETILHALEDNDVLAACFARCLLWTLPDALPKSTEAPAAWRMYLDGWKPGKPRVETWKPYYQTAWSLVGRQPDLKA